MSSPHPADPLSTLAAAAAAAGRPVLPVATVSVLDVFARVVEIQVQLAAINERLADLPDHETRLRLLERFRYTLAGLAIVGGGLSGYVGYLLGSHR